jgi:hypothetical protein
MADDAEAAGRDADADEDEDESTPDGRNFTFAALQEEFDNESAGGAATRECRALAFVAAPLGPQSTRLGCSRALVGPVNSCGQVTLHMVTGRPMLDSLARVVASMLPGLLAVFLQQHAMAKHLHEASYHAAIADARASGTAVSKVLARHPTGQAFVWQLWDLVTALETHVAASARECTPPSAASAGAAPLTVGPHPFEVSFSEGRDSHEFPAPTRAGMAVHAARRFTFSLLSGARTATVQFSGAPCLEVMGLMQYALRLMLRVAAVALPHLAPRLHQLVFRVACTSQIYAGHALTARLSDSRRRLMAYYLEQFELCGFTRDRAYRPDFAAAADFAAWFVDDHSPHARHFIKASLDPNLGAICMIAPNTDFAPVPGREPLVTLFMGKLVALCTTVHALSDAAVALALCYVRATGQATHRPGNAARNLC